MKFAELLAAEGVVESSVLRSPVGVMAFHGGNLERMTAEIATIVADQTGSSLYTVTQPHPMRSHVSSSKVVAADSRRLADFFAHVDVVFALHGYGREGFWTSILLGGSNRELACALGSTMRAELPDFDAVDDIELIPSELRGLHPTNPVNVPRNGGVQIELPPRVRGLTPHAATMEHTDGMIEWTHALIRALTKTISDLSHR